MILDGLHSASSCIHRALPFLENSGYVIENGVRGTIPPCLLQMPSLSVLHLGGNSISGSIPDVLFTQSLVEFIAPSNQLTGAIPSSLWQSNVTVLDLSLNRLQGTLSDTMLTALTTEQASTGSLKLKVNELSGTIPLRLQGLAVIDILEGNLFSCDTTRNALPKNDPKYHSYSCGSDSTNDALIAFAAIAVVCVIVTWFAGSDNLLDWKRRYFEEIDREKEIEREKGLEIGKENASKRATENPEGNMAATRVSSAYLAGIEQSLCAIESFTQWITVYIVVFGLIIYSVLKIFYSTYSFTYIWTVSAIYVSGLNAGIVTFLFFCGLLCLTISSSYVLLTNTAEDSLDTADTHIDVNTDKESSSKESVSSWTLGIGMSTSWLCDRNIWWSFLVILVNITVAMVVNGAYVYAVSHSNSIQVLLLISLSVSVFKVIWNFLVLGGWEMRSPCHHNASLETTTTMLSDHALFRVSLFNHVIAPFLAELFVSPDCFLYIVREAPVLTFVYNSFVCQFYTNPFTDTIRTEVVCDASDSATSTLTVLAPFHYSYQCSFTLLANYVYIFVFRSIWRCFAELLLTWFLKQFHVLLRQFRGKSYSAHMYRMSVPLVPVLWRLEGLDPQLHMKTESEGDTVRNREMEKERLEVSLQSLELYFTKPFKWRRQLVGRWAIDLVLLLCLGALFPLLALVIAISVCKDCWEIRCALGRLSLIVSSTNDLAEDTIKQRLKSLQEKVHQESTGMTSLLQEGLWLGIRLSVCIWAYILFDTLSPAVGFGQSLWFVVLMILLPYPLRYGCRYFAQQRKQRQRVIKSSLHGRGNVSVDYMTSTGTTIKNPIFEMKGLTNQLQD
jgi:hypothetical protein